MTRYGLVLAALLIGAPAAAAGAAAAQEQPEPGTSTQGEAESPPNEALNSLLENCEAHKFEKTVEYLDAGGEPRRSKVRMCGKEGQSDAEWVRTLEDAIEKLSANTEMPAAMRDQLIAAIGAEIDRLTTGKTQDTAALLPPPRAKAGTAESPWSDYNIVKPLPSQAPTPPRLLERSSEPAAAETRATNASATASPSPTPHASTVAIAKPRLTFSCMSPEFPSGGPCITLSRDTMITVKAEATAGSLSLRFVRQGDRRADVALAAMRKGQSFRLSLPQPVCSGVVSSEVVMEVVAGGRVVDRQGPYLLRC